MLIVPRDCGTGIGISPPARKLALCPDNATSVGSASSRARLFDSSRLRFAKIPREPRFTIRLKALLMGDADATCKFVVAPPVNDVSDEGAKVPNANALFCLKRLKPASFSTDLLNSTTFTSTWTTGLAAIVDASRISPPFASPPLPPPVADESDEFPLCPPESLPADADDALDDPAVLATDSLATANAR